MVLVTFVLAAPNWLQQDLDAALALMRSGDYDKALAALSVLILDHPDRGEFYLHRGRCYAHKTDNEKALADFAQALAKLPSDQKELRLAVLVARGEIYLQREAWARALADAEAALVLLPENAAPWRLRAQLTYQMGDYEGARADDAEARQRQSTLAPLDLSPQQAAANRQQHPNAYRAYFELGFTALGRKDYEHAVVYFERVGRLEPNVPTADLNAGVAHFYLQHWEKALASYARCIEKCGSDDDNRQTKAQAQVNQASVYREQDELDLALKACEAALVTDPTLVAALRVRAVVHYEMGDYDTAVADYMLARQRDPKLAPLTLTREGAAANAALQAEKRDPNLLLAQLEKTAPGSSPRAEILADLERLTRRDNRAEVWCRRGQAEVLVQPPALRHEKALPFFDRALERDPKFADAYYYRGLLRLQNPTSDGAEKARGAADLDQAIVLGSKGVAAWAERGKWRLAQQDSAGALADFTEVLTREPGQSDIRALRAGLYEKALDWKNALADRTALVEKTPTAEGFIARAKVYLALKEAAKAVSDCNQALALEPSSTEAKALRTQAQKALTTKPASPAKKPPTKKK